MRKLFAGCAGKLKSERGQTFILVTTVTALATVLGIMAMGGALLSLRMRGMKRLSDKNFYRLELAVNEIGAGIAGDVTANIKTSDADTWTRDLLSSRLSITDISLLDEDTYQRMASRRAFVGENAAQWLESFSLTIPAESRSMAVTDRTEEIKVTVGDIALERGGAVVLKDVAVTLTNYERDAQAAVYCDVKIMYPIGRSGVDEVVRLENWRRVG